MRSSQALLTLLAPCGLAAGVQAQPMSWPPKVLYVERVEVHPGHGSAYAKAAAGLLAIFARAGSTGYCLGLSTVAGNEDEMLFLFGYDSIEAMEKDQAVIGGALSGSLRTEARQLGASEAAARVRQRAMIAVYRPDISYRAGGVALDKVRYVFVNQHLVKFGGSAGYIADNKAIVVMLEKADVDRHYWMYSVIAGAPSGTGLRIEPMRSLADLDLVNGPALMAKLRPTLDEEAVKKLEALWKDFTVQVAPGSDSPGSPDVGLFAVDPSMSYVGKEIAAADPDFWSASVAAAGKKKKTKTEAERE